MEIHKLAGNCDCGTLKTNYSQRYCTLCGKEPHSLQKCPAKEAICHKCHRRGHYESQCFSKSVSEVTRQNGSIPIHDDSEVIHSTFFDTVSSFEGKSWIAQLQIQDKKVKYKIDTGAEVTAISTETFKQLNGCTLNKSGKRLCGP